MSLLQGFIESQQIHDAGPITRSDIVMKMSSAVVNSGGALQMSVHTDSKGGVDMRLGSKGTILKYMNVDSIPTPSRRTYADGISFAPVAEPILIVTAFPDCTGYVVRDLTCFLSMRGTALYTLKTIDIFATRLMAEQRVQEPVPKHPAA